MAKFMPVQFPAILGFEVSGEVVALGSDINKYQIGDLIYGRGQNAYAEYVLLNEDNSEKIPNNISSIDAASIPSGSQIAYSALIDVADLKNGQSVLIFGASGGVGSLAVQIARVKGADVSAVTSTKNIQLLKEIGVDHIVNYEEESIVDLEKRFDVIIDILGGNSQKQAWELLKENGHLVSLVSDDERSPSTSKKFTFMRGIQQAHLGDVSQLIEDGKVKPVIDTVFDFKDIQKAHLKSEQGHVSGKIIVKI